MLSDGFVDDVGRTLEVLRQHSSSCCVYAFGIGEQVQKEFIKGMARASNLRSPSSPLHYIFLPFLSLSVCFANCIFIARGTAEFIGNGDDLENACIRQINMALRSSWSSIFILFSSPPSLPPLSRPLCLISLLILAIF